MLPSFANPLRFVLLAAGVLIAPLVGGCYNGEALVDRARNHALRTRIETVSLGKFNVTMPTGSDAYGMTEVQVEPFGRAVRYKIADTEDLIEEHQYLLRHAVVLTVRSSKGEDFADPNLTRLRERLLTAVRESLEDDAISSIGFANIRFVTH